MALQDVLNSADSSFQEYWSDIQSAQEAHFQSEGHYWQGVVTHGPPSMPLNGTPTAPDRLSEAPTDQPVSWDDFVAAHGLSLPSTFEQAVAIHAYQSPSGHGFASIRRLVFEGSTYRNRTDVGPLDTGHGWVEEEKPDAGNDPISWEAGLQLGPGQKVTYEGSTYVTIQSHTTQADWTPDIVPALFSVVPSGSDNWQAGVEYSINDEVVYNGQGYTCIQAHTSQEGWEPPNTPALWSAL